MSASQADLRCPKCAQPIALGSSFCGNCGQKIYQAGGVPPHVAAGPSASGPTAFGPTAATPPQPLNLNALLQRAKGIVLAPRQEWPLIAPETTSPSQLYVGYVIPLVALAALLSFLRLALIGTRVPFIGTLRIPFFEALRDAAFGLVMGLVGVFLLALIIQLLAPAFGGVRDQRQALKASAYSLTPAYLGSILALSPILPSLLQLLAGLYGIYVLYLGLPILMRSRTESAVGYTVSVVLCSIVMGFVLGAALGSLSILGLRDRTPLAQERETDAVAGVLGSVLGTDSQGKAGLSAALANVVKAGENARNAAPAPASAPATSTAATAAVPGGDQTQQALGAAGGLLTALGGALRTDHSVDTVDAKSLKELLPTSLLGMSRSNAEVDNNQAVGIKTASAKADYRDANAAGNPSIHLEISDLSGLSALMDIANGLAQNSSSEGDSGFETDKVIEGRKVHEKYNAGAKTGEVSVILVKRYQVELSGDAVDMGSLEKALGQIDLSRLEAMQKAGATS